jgi:uncharacterized protein YcbK (DUF882 family)
MVSVTHRRQFLAASGTALLCSLGTPSLAAVPALLNTQTKRALSFNNLHTGDRANIEYWAEGRYEPGALAEINHVLRDWRNNEVHDIDPRLLDLLHVINGKLETSEPFEVISGYRSPATNALLHAESSGVAAKSLHMKGMAIDIRVPGRALSVLHETAVALRIGGVGYYPSPDFVHVDVGRVRYWGQT